MVGRRAGGRRRVAHALERQDRCQLLRAACIAGLAAVALACARDSLDANSGLLDRAGAEAPRHFVVLPVNLTIKTPSEFDPLLDDMFGAIAGYIRDRGHTLETFSRKKATAGWAASILRVQESETLDDNFKTAMRVYVRRLAETRSFDAVISPSLAYRNAKSRDRKVKWDGVIRKVKIINLSDEAKNKGLARSLAVEIAGVSLHVMAFDPGGELIFQKYGGLDLAHDVDMEGVEFTMIPRLALKEALLKDGEHIEQGIGVAFDPFIPRR